MAAIILLSQMDEDDKKKKRLIQTKKKKELEEYNIMYSSMNFNNVTQYGLMWFYAYITHGVQMSNHKVIITNKDKSVVIEELKSRVINCLNNKYKESYMVYEVKNVDPNMVSYNVIKSSTYPYVCVRIFNRKSNKICSINGNKILKAIVCEKLDFLADYLSYLEDLEKLSTKDLEGLYKEVYGKKPGFLFARRFIITALLDNKKRGFIENY